MAISTSSFFSNSIVGQMQIGSDIDIYETSTAPKFSIGAGFMRSDGNQYRYAEFGALAARGQVVCGNGGGATTSLTCVSAALVSPTLVRYPAYAYDPNGASANYLQVLITATANQYRGGYITIANTGSGGGYSYRIKGNTAVGTPSTGYCYIDIYDKLVGPVDTTSAITIASSKWNDVVPGLGTNLTGTALAGVSVVNQSAGSFGWVCTRGYTHVLQGAATGSQGSLAMLSTNTAGAVSLASVYGTNTSINAQIVGQLVMPASNTGYSLIDVWLE